MGNVIPARFDSEFFDYITSLIRKSGIKRTIHYLFEHAGFHPSFIGAAVRKIMRERGG